MFKNIFSFEGRIRRLEYGISFILFFLINIFTSEFSDSTIFLSSLYLFILIISYWIVLAQGAKRCHDMGDNGFYQFIPFFFIVMMLREGDKRGDKYGLSPKSKEYRDQKTPNFPPLNVEINHLLVSQLLSVSMLMLLGMSIGNYLLPSTDTIAILLFFTLPIIGFFIIILLDKKTNSIKKIYRQLVYKQLLFSLIYYLLIRSYAVLFLGAVINIETIFLELIILSLLFGVSYIPIGLHILIFNQKGISNE